MYPTPYVKFLAHFHGTRDYFECHEVLEEYWKEVDPKNRSSIWVLFIQTAVCMYHYRRDNKKGADTLIKRCILRAESGLSEIEELGVDAESYLEHLNRIKSDLQEDLPYHSWNIPLTDLYLRQEVQQMCLDWGVAYGSPSDLDNAQLVYKHKLRNKQT
ncbi:DUF309 domain-containing protein [Halobacillus sp. ACCC02827]|uniref:DUF309 domain-containing protein n=1 Tax=unclassified Halobacillus TaxID=2636472 RepID=UPI0002A4F618|nr:MULTISPECIES: DUF309 domain-containing protein [unclassified Halobacillus]ELK44426.1 hypothetical protein D479_19104 [Halobacillus sp. BAB-2008]WJE14142.1 DUF309 domain-containing protein [Halobacillus sp. ACCC02827]